MRIPALTMLVVFAITTVASAATLRVRRDGSGDYSTIQPALDAAAAADTIDIGPGEFTEFEVVQPGYWDWDVEIYGYVTVDNLTIIGAGVDQTIIGPTQVDFDWAHDSPEGFWAGLQSTLAVKDLTIRNCLTAIYGPHSYVSVSGVKFEMVSSGLFDWAVAADVIDCIAIGIDANEYGVITAGSGVCDHLAIRDCSFQSCRISLNIVEDYSIENCDFANGALAISSSFSSGTIARCTISNTAITAVVFNNISSASIQSMSITDCQFGIGVAAGSTLLGDRISVSGTTSSAVFFSMPGEVRIHNSEFLPTSGRVIDCTSTSDPPLQHHDFSHNYWGVTDSTAIAALIWDHNDDPRINEIVNFMPFEGESTPTQETSWGAVKSLFNDAVGK